MCAKGMSWSLTCGSVLRIMRKTDETPATLQCGAGRAPQPLPRPPAEPLPTRLFSTAGINSRALADVFPEHGLNSADK